MITEKHINKNLERVWQMSDPFLIDGKEWYYKARDYADELANEFNIDLYQSSAIISALSPLKSWDLNKRIAKEFLEGKRNIHFYKQVQKAKNILRTKKEYRVPVILNGRKTVSFYKNIYTPWDNEFVTIDTHVVNCLIAPNANITPKRYNLIQTSITNHAKKVNLRPCEVQATIWITHKHFK